MGLLDRLRAILPGGDKGVRRVAAGHEGTGSTTTDFADVDPAVQTHGSHWDTLVPEADRETAIQELTMRTVSEGEALAVRDGDAGNRTAHRFQDGPLGTFAVSEDGRVATAYPVADGTRHTLEVAARHEWASGVEAWIGGTLGDAAVRAFAANDVQHPPDHYEGDVEVGLALSMYTLGRSSYDTVVGEDGEELDVSDFVGFRPMPEGGPDDYVVRTVVEDVEPVSHEGYDAHRIEAPLHRTPDDTAVPVTVYVGEHALEDDLSVGDSIEGAGWLQAWVH